MHNGKCPKCGSTEIYKRARGALDVGESSVSLSADTGELFSVETFLCANCRYIENYATEVSVRLFGKGKSLVDALRASDKWKHL